MKHPKPIYASDTYVEWFHSMVARTDDPDECWLWTGDFFFGNREGYGDAGVNSAHRLAFWIENRRQPVGGEVRHTCDVRACCNPHHLIEGTHKQNMEDAVQRDRGVGIAKGPKGRLLPGQKEEIESSNEKAWILAERYGVTTTNIYRIKREWRQQQQKQS